MVFDILKNAEKTWREIASLATPLDSDKPVIMKAETKQGDLEAYTDDKRIYVNIDPVKLKKNFEGIIVPVYKDEGKRVYSIRRDIDNGDLLSNLVFDNFLFVLFHEQLHPWLCPNSKEDERKITKTLYDGIKEAEPTMTKSQIFAKVNNSKNLIWDVVLNVSFLSKTGNANDNLENKIEFVFEKDDRKIKLERILRYPNGILPIVYAISANNRTTDIPISLVGGMYGTLSFNSPQLRTKVNHQC